MQKFHASAVLGCVLISHRRIGCLFRQAAWSSDNKDVDCHHWTRCAHALMAAPSLIFFRDQKHNTQTSIRCLSDRVDAAASNSWNACGCNFVCVCVCVCARATRNSKGTLLRKQQLTPKKTKLRSVSAYEVEGEIGEFVQVEKLAEERVWSSNGVTDV